jgi:hypothetical protein
VKEEKRVYAEIGFGNDTFLNTEVETWENGEEKSEIRIPKFILPKKIDEFYLRFWLGEKVYIFSTKNMFSIKFKKNRRKIKVLFGIGGSGYKK